LRGLSSAASAGNAAMDHIHDWVYGSDGRWVNMGVISTGHYGVPKGLCFSYPVVCSGGWWNVVILPYLTRNAHVYEVDRYLKCPSKQKTEFYGWSYGFNSEIALKKISTVVKKTPPSPDKNAYIIDHQLNL